MIYHETRSETDVWLWEQIVAREGENFRTSRGLEFTYHIKRNRNGEQVGEMVIDRKEKTVTRNTVVLAYENAMKKMEEEGCVKGPKKLGVFGASYLYPIFLSLGICTRENELTETAPGSGKAE